MKLTAAPIAVCALFVGTTLFAEGIAFDSAKVTRVENKVVIGETSKGRSSNHSAAVSDVVKASNYVQTQTDSRAELEFKDHSLVRVGQNSIFSFDASSRTLSLQKGDMLFYVPPGSGGGTIKTPALTAAITGTLGKVTENMIVVLQGEIMTDCGKVEAGYAIKVVNGVCHIFKFDPSQATVGKLYAMGPLPEFPGVNVLAPSELKIYDGSPDKQENTNLNEFADKPPKNKPEGPIPPPIPPPPPHKNPGKGGGGEGGGGGGASPPPQFNTSNRKR